MIFQEVKNEIYYESKIIPLLLSGIYVVHVETIGLILRVRTKGSGATKVAGKMPKGIHSVHLHRCQEL